MFWRDIRFDKPTEKDGNLVAKVVGSKRHVVRSWRHTESIRFWFPESELPEISQTDVIPEGWRPLNRDKDARALFDAMFWDNTDNLWRSVSPLSTEWLPNIRYIVRKVSRYAPIPTGWRLADRAVDKFTTEAKWWCSGTKEWRQTKNTERDGWGGNDYIIPDEPSPVYGAIPAGWRLVDQKIDKYTLSAMFWLNGSRTWTQTGNSTWAKGLTYIIPVDEPGPGYATIPAGWRLVDKTFDKFTTEAKYWSTVNKEWCKTVNKPSCGWGCQTYIVADKTTAELLTEFNAGDTVRVWQKIEPNDWKNVWARDMDSCIGKVGTITTINECGCRVTFDGTAFTGWWYPPQALEHVKQEPASSRPTYASLHEACGIKVGDTVLVSQKTSPRDIGWKACWVEPMDNFAGRTGVVRFSSVRNGFTVVIDGISYCYPCTSLQKVVFPTSVRCERGIWAQTSMSVVAAKTQYRPFANGEEFEPFANKWWRFKEDSVGTRRPPGPFQEDSHITVSWDSSFNIKVFADGTPFGMPISE